MSPVIVTCAVTGSIHTPSLSPHLPFAARDIEDQAVAAARAGAAILHLHARDPLDGRPSARAEHFMGFLPGIKRRCDAVINISTGGSAVMTLDQRLEGALTARPEMCSLNMGSMNFALFPLAERERTWRFGWERPFLEGTDDLVFKNTPRDIARILHEMGEMRGARFEFECYDMGHLAMLRHFVQSGLVRPPLFIQFVFGVLGGMAAEPENLRHMKRLADDYFGADYMFSALAAGRAQMPFARMAADMGGHVRVGLEDSLYIDRGVLAVSNAQQVEKACALVKAQGRRVATPAEARDMLGLKGAADVGF